MRLRTYIWIRDGGICVYCKDEVSSECDHVIPISAGGPTKQNNLVLACRRCNVRKKNSIREGYLIIAFKHLLSVGESLDWVDGLFLPAAPVPPSDDELVPKPEGQE